MEARRVRRLRPGEIIGLQRRHVQPTAVKIEQRVCAGRVDTPKVQGVVAIGGDPGDSRFGDSGMASDAS